MGVDFAKLPREGDPITAKRRFDDETKEEEQVTYVITGTIGSGAFGAVFKGECEKDGSVVAIKCEPVDCKKRMLQQEFSVMRAGRSSGSPYFTDYGERGRVPGKYFFFTMQLVGRNLWDLLVATQGKGFTLYTTCRVAVQTLAGVRDLHEIARLHRDIKPANFAVGRKDDDKDSIIYMLDFGMCRKFRNEVGKLKRKRESARFRGTNRYASIGSLDNKEQCRKDDIESWFYMTMEFAVGNVPWNMCRGNGKEARDEVLRKKREFRENREYNDFMGDCEAKIELKRILKYIDDMEFASIPDYDGIHRIILKVVETHDWREAQALDWSPRRAYQPPDWDRQSYVPVRDRYSSDDNRVRRHQETVTDSSSKAEKGGQSVNETVTGAGLTATGIDGRKEEREEEKGQRRKKEKEREREKKKPSKKSESDKNNSAHVEKLAELKASQKRNQQTPTKPTKGKAAASVMLTPPTRQKESRKADKDVTGGGGASKMIPNSGKRK